MRLTDIGAGNRKNQSWGLKILEGGACVVASFPRLKAAWPKGSAPLWPLIASTSTYLSHVAGDLEVLCTAAHFGEEALPCSGPGWRRGGHSFQPASSIISIYPHDKHPEIIGNFIRSLARARVIIHGLASSPSAISAVISAKKSKSCAPALSGFSLSGLRGARGFLRGPESAGGTGAPGGGHLSGKVIKVYWIVPQADWICGA